ncbi:MAG: hypothetical protein ACOX4K_00960 [Bacillota bacterium]|jgi:hypothetical protein
MQLNIYIPKGKESLLSRLDSIAGRLGKAKNEIVIEALEQYFRLYAGTVQLGRYNSRVTGSLSRRDIYGDRPKGNGSQP